MTDGGAENFGRYELGRRLAFGGMAEIFLAVLRRDQGFAKTVVLKRILSQFGADPEFVRMFIDEAVLAARLSHPNVVQVYDFGNVEGVYFIAMEFVDGVDLRRLLRGAAENRVPVPLADIASIGESVCRGLAYAHEAADDHGAPLGIVHRDVSPHNILISRSGETKVTDFGIAKASARASFTAAGAIRGKVAYMSPEQATGRPIDARADQFSLGAVLWECLSGHRLFQGDSDLQVLQAVARGEIAPIQSHRPEVPDALAVIVMRMLAVHPAERYPDLRAAHDDLARFRFTLGDEGVSHLDALVRQADRSSKSAPQATPVRRTRALEPAAQMELPETTTVLDPPGELSESTTLADPPGKPSARKVLVAAAGVIGVLAALAAVAVWHPWTHAAVALPHVAPVAVELEISSLPAGAKILLDAADTGLKTPSRIPLPARGQRLDVTLMFAGFRPSHTLIESAGKPDRLFVELEASAPAPGPVTVPARGAIMASAVTPVPEDRGAGWLSLRAAQGWFEVFLGPRRLGETPMEHVPVPAGRLVLRLVSPDSGEEKNLTLTVPTGTEIRRTIAFESVR